MKIGDIVMSTKVRPYDNAKIVKSEVTVKRKENGRKETRTKYIAKYLDGSELTFYGFNINKSIFKIQEADGQMCLADFMTWPEEEKV